MDADKQGHAITLRKVLLTWSAAILAMMLVSVIVAVASGESVWTAAWRGMLSGLLIAAIATAGVVVLNRRRRSGDRPVR